MTRPDSAAGMSAQPVPGPEAFEENSADARLSQAALVLSTAAGVAGETEGVDHSERFPLPDLDRLYHPAPISMAEAAGPIDIDTAEYVAGYTGEITQAESARLARRLYQDPEPETAAALVETALHSQYRLVRTAGAAAALDTTGPREDVLAVLDDSARNGDPTSRDLARVALARIRPDHPFLQRLETKPMRIKLRTERSNTAVITHGTFASNTTWWRPGGTLYGYLDGLAPPLHLHTAGFRWSGIYSPQGRDSAADQLVAWVAAENLNRPDLFAHSHGVTVANLATHKGLGLDRLVMLAWPVHSQWLPDLTRVNTVISLRVRFDLVIIVDRGGQRLPANLLSNQVHERVEGWFRHSDPIDPAFWDRFGLPSEL